MDNENGRAAQDAIAYARPLTPEEAAEYLKVSKRTLLDLARRGQIPGRKIGNRWRFSPTQLAGFMGIDG